MTIKNLGGVFGRNPTFNDVTIEGQLTFDGDIDINSDLSVDGALDVTGLVTSEGLVHNGDSNTYVKFLPDRIYMDVGGNRGIDLEVNSTKIVNNGTVKLQTSSTDGLVVDANQDVQIPNGNIEMSSGHGIDFSASGTAGPELFDDYEEGTWTPNFLNGTGITYNSRSGNYTKIGNLVHVTASIDVSNSDTSDASAITIGGLPFNASDDTMTFTLGRYRGFLGAKSTIVIGASANASFIQLYESNNNFILYSEINSSGVLYFSGSYLT